MYMYSHVHLARHGDILSYFTPVHFIILSITCKCEFVVHVNTLHVIKERFHTCNHYSQYYKLS